MDEIQDGLSQVECDVLVRLATVSAANCESKSRDQAEHKHHHSTRSAR